MSQSQAMNSLPQQQPSMAQALSQHSQQQQLNQLQSQPQSSLSSFPSSLLGAVPSLSSLSNPSVGGSLNSTQLNQNQNQNQPLAMPLQLPNLVGLSGASIPPAANSAPPNNFPSRLYQHVLDLTSIDKREAALLELSKKREEFPDLAPILWHSFGTITALVQEIVSIYPLLSPPRLTPGISNRCCNALALLQCVASHPDTRSLFLNSHLGLFLYPFLNTVCTYRQYEYLRLTSLGVIGALVKMDDPEVISFLLQTEIIPLCFPENETRVLTDRGFLYLNEIESLLAAGNKLTYACYQIASESICYRTGSLVIPNSSDVHLIDFNNSNDFSLRVTAAHRMYAAESIDNENQKFGETKIIPATDLLSDSNTSSNSTIRMISCIPNGLETVNDSTWRSAILSRLGLSNSDEFHSFIQFYGFWLNSTTTDENQIKLSNLNSTDSEWIINQLTQCGLSNSEWNCEFNDGNFDISINSDRWIEVFEEFQQDNSPPAELNTESEFSDSTDSATHLQRSNIIESWILQLNKSECRFFIDGLQRAGGSADGNIILTASIPLRDKIVQLLIHAGFSPHYQFNTENNNNSWSIEFSESDSAGFPQINRSKGIHRSNYNRSLDGRVWCVTVDHPDSLIIAQRIDKSSNRSFRPVVTGNCLRIMDNGSELSKTVATFIIQKILLDDMGLNYICATYERFSTVSSVLSKMVIGLVERPSVRLLKHIVRCYLRLSDNARARETLRSVLPGQIRDSTFVEVLKEDPVTKRWLAQLLFNIGEAAAQQQQQQQQQ